MAKRKVSEKGPEAEEALVKSEDDERTVAALGHILQTTDRIISGRPVNVVMAESDSGTPAAMKGVNIVLNRDQIHKTLETHGLADTVAVTVGTNYHELAHVMFSPTKGDWLRAQLNHQRKYFRIWNILEDQRIETLYTKLYAGTTHYFVHAVSRWLLYEVEELGGVYPYLICRLFMPTEVRAKARAAYLARASVSLTMLAELEGLVREFVLLPFPLQEAQERGWEIVKAVSKLLGSENAADLGNGPVGPDTPGDSGTGMGDGDIDPDSLIDAIQEAQDQIEQEDADGSLNPKPPTERVTTSGSGSEDDDESADEDGLGTQNAGDLLNEPPGDGPGGSVIDDYHKVDDEGLDVPDDGTDGGADADSDGDASGKGDNGSAQGESSDSAADGSAGGGGAGGPGSMAGSEIDNEHDLLSAAEEAMADVQASPTFQEDVNRVIDAVNAQTERDRTAGDSYNQFKLVTIEPGDEAVCSKIVDRLRTIHSDLEPTWVRDQLVGRINRNKALKHMADPTMVEIFDQWDEGNEEAAKTEVVIALDLSTSMEHTIGEASRVLWTLKRSFDRIGYPCTVLGFSNDNVVLYQSTERVHPNQAKSFNVWSGTSPNNTLKVAHRLLRTSNATNKVFVAVTDGVWSEGAHWASDAEATTLPNNQLVRMMRKSGVHTLLFGIDMIWKFQDTHDFETAVSVKHTTEIIPVIDKLVFKIMQKARRSR